MQQTLAKINIVGTGPGSPDLVTPAARKAVQHAKVVIGAQRSLNLFTGDIKGETMVLTAKNLNVALKHAAESAAEGKTVALLSTGDPGFSGMLHTVLESNLVNPEEVDVIPGVSSIQACAASLGLSWDNACLFTFHEGKVTSKDKAHLLSCVKEGKKVMLLPDSRAFPPSKIASFLLESGIDQQTNVFVCENLTLPQQRIISSTLGKVVDKSFESLCVMVIRAENGKVS